MARTTIYRKNLKARFHATYGNTKTGGKAEKMLSIGYLPSNDLIYLKNGTLLCDIIGTCNAVNCESCKCKCYGVRTVKQYTGATINCAENTLQLRKDIEQHFQDIHDCIVRDNIQYVRYTYNGEIESFEQFKYLVNLAQRLPSVYFYLYTKNYKVLRDFFAVSELPANLTVLVSTWHGYGEKEYNEFKNHAGVKKFAVVDTNENAENKIFCPAYKIINGKSKLNKEMTCAKCGLCFGKHPIVKEIYCFEH